MNCFVVAVVSGPGKKDKKGMLRCLCIFQTVRNLEAVNSLLRFLFSIREREEK